MKVIITGATGFVGSALARQSIADPRISSVLILTRRAPEDDIAGDAKVTVIEHDDFASYPPELLAKLVGAEACLWAIGGRVDQFPDAAACRKAHIEFAAPAARAFTELGQGKKFKFVFCSGKFAEWDQKKRLLFLQETRRIKGEVEKALCDMADDNPSRLEVFILRPSGILPVGAGPVERMTGKLYGAVWVDKLAKVMVDLLFEGQKDRIIENNAILRLAS